jgi:actin related protein 2/3 complex subunit 3
LTLALETGRKMPIPGDAAFPFPGLFKPPASPADEEVMRSYLQQLRQELGVRLVELVFPNPDGPPSKVFLLGKYSRLIKHQ